MRSKAGYGVALVVDGVFKERMPLTRSALESKEQARAVAAMERRLSGYTVDYRAAMFNRSGMWDWLDEQPLQPKAVMVNGARKGQACTWREAVDLLKADHSLPGSFLHTALLPHYTITLGDGPGIRVYWRGSESDQAFHVDTSGTPFGAEELPSLAEDRMTAGAGTMVAAHSMTVLADAVVVVDGEAYAWLEPGQRQQGYRPRITIVTPDASIRLVRQCGPVSCKVAEARSGQAVDVLVARVLSLLGDDGYAVERE